MRKPDLLHLLDAIEDALAEFIELVNTHEWYATDVIDKLTSSREIVKDHMRGS